MLFRDRIDAGRLLGARLRAYAGRDDTIVLGLPRGGVPVADEVARALDAPLDVFLVRKLGTPGQEELAMGAVATGGVRVLNEEVVDALRIPPAAVEAATAREGAELERREREYRGPVPAPALSGRTVIVVDDGLATGSTMRAVVEAVRQQQPARLVVGVPVGAPDTCSEFRRLVDDVVCVATPEPFLAVGRWYGDFSETTDDDVRRILAEAHARRGERTGRAAPR